MTISTNAQRQALFSEKQRSAGKKKISVWAMPGDAALIQSLIKERESKIICKLVGTEKQVNWAKDIRAGWITVYKSGKVTNPQLEQLLLAIKKMAEAHWWIECRGIGLPALLNKAQLVLADKPPPYLFNADLASDLLAEATLFPKNEVKRHLTVDFSLDGEKTVLRGSEYSPKLTDFAKSWGFVWNSDCWIKNSLDLEGFAPDEQAVAVAVELLNSNFALTIFNEALRERVVKQDYRPIPVRIIDIYKSAKYGWQFRLSGRDKEFPNRIDAISDLLRGKVFSTTICCPLSRYETIVDVAKMYGFVMTQRAKDAIATQEKNHLKRIGIAVDAKPKREHLKENDPLAATPAGIDEALLDV